MSAQEQQVTRPPSLFVGVPCYDGKLEYKTVRGLIQLAMFCASKGVKFGVDVVPGDAFIGKARSTIATRFLNSGFDELLFIDADVGFTLDSAKQLLRSDVDIAAGIYRVKQMKLKFPSLMHEPMERHPQDARLLRMQYVAAGFMKIRRSVFEKMIEQYPDDYYMAGEHKIYDFFPCGRYGNNFTGEDIKFCERALACGFNVWGVQGVELVHTGAHGFESAWAVDVPMTREMHVPMPIADSPNTAGMEAFAKREAAA